MGCLLFHKWSDWTPVAGKCEEEQRCSKCGDVKKREAHALSDWQRVPGKCLEERACTNPWCGKKEQRKVAHSFGSWEYYEDGCCTQRRRCTVCGEAEYREQCPAEKTETEVAGKCQTLVTCPRCGLQEVRSLPHDWDDTPGSYRACVTARLQQEKQDLALADANVLTYTSTAESDKLADALARQAELRACAAQSERLLQACTEAMNGRVCRRCGTIQRIGRRDS